MSFSEISDINRLPYGDPDFANIREIGSIYVDKTKLIYEIASQRAPLFFSRPRRFGKSLLVNTLHSLFSTGLKYFKGLDIEKVWDDKTYKVVHLDFSTITPKTPLEFKRALGDTIIEEFNVKGTIAQYDEMGVRDPDRIFNEIARKLTNNSVVLLIDEYDAPITHHLDKPDELKDILSILNSFYATVKQYTGKFRLIFITGVTRTSHISIFSAFNNLLDISFKPKFNSILGFTENDIHTYFDKYVEYASHMLCIEKEDVYIRIKQYYDGYRFSYESKETVYNPWSVLSFFKQVEDGFQNYWFESGGTPSIIMEYLKISKSFNLLAYKDNRLTKTRRELSAKYEIDNIPEEILLLQAGYFTIQNEENQTVRLIFPNIEVEDSILSLYLTANNITLGDNTNHQITTLIESIDNKNLLSITKTFNAILNDCVSILSKIFDNERSIRDIIYAALPQKIDFQKIKERETNRGNSDLELVTKKTHMVIEFKLASKKCSPQSSLEQAIKQIQSKEYGIGAYRNHQLYYVAMVISKDEKRILQKFCQEVLP